MTTQRARALGRQQTDAEALLRQHLRAGQSGVKFRRQHPFGPHVLDFFSPEAHLVIEVDGSQHFEADAALHDEERTRYLEAAGFQVLRFDDRQVLTETEAVLEAIWVATRGYSPSP